jgi:hypothetical protein
MSAKWQDALLQAAAFDRFSMPEQPRPEQLAAQQRFTRLMLHLVSLMQVRRRPGALGPRAPGPPGPRLGRPPLPPAPAAAGAASPRPLPH